MHGGHFPQYGQHRIGREMPAERRHGGLALEKMLRRQPLQGGEGGMDRFDSAAGPTQHPGQFDIQSQVIYRRLETWSTFDLIDHHLDLVQCARDPGGKTIGE